MFIPIFCFSQTIDQLTEIKKRGLNIEKIKNIRGKLDLENGDGYSYQSLKAGDYSDNNYMLEVYVYYASKLYSALKKPSSFISLSSEKRKEFLLYFIENFDKDSITEWERNEWAYSKILIENINLWEYIVDF